LYHPAAFRRPEFQESTNPATNYALLCDFANRDHHDFRVLIVARSIVGASAVAVIEQNSMKRELLDTRALMLGSSRPDASPIHQQPTLPHHMPTAHGSGSATLTTADLWRDDLTGLHLHHYQLGRRIGQGGMGQVFLAVHSTLGKTFAIKFMAADVLQNDEAAHRFLEEVASVGQLRHPHLLNAVDAGCTGGIHYLVTEYIDGADLGRLIAERGPLPAGVSCEIIRQAAEGLAHAHSLGFIHRDIKPSNLILDRHGVVRLLDFGLVRRQHADSGNTSLGQLLGTVDFLAPEQAVDGRLADCRSDLYGLGCTLLFLLTGKPPYSGAQYDSVAAKLQGHLFAEPPALADDSVEIPPAVRHCLRRLMAKQSEQRFQSAAELLQCLNGTVSTPSQIRNLVNGVGGSCEYSPEPPNVPMTESVGLLSSAGTSGHRVAARRMFITAAVALCVTMLLIAVGTEAPLSTISPTTTPTPLLTQAQSPTSLPELAQSPMSDEPPTAAVAESSVSDSGADELPESVPRRAVPARTEVPHSVRNAPGFHTGLSGKSFQNSGAGTLRRTRFEEKQ
jgi:serine/threonine protein kinase